MHVDFHLSKSEQGKFKKACEAAIGSVGNGTKKAVTEAGYAILEESWQQVPVDTGALISSYFLGVGRRDVKGYRYGAILGYGKPAGMAGAAGLDKVEWVCEPTDPVNPKNGKNASFYAGRVHEDTDMPHVNGGKAKFLEDPIRSWASGKFARTALTYWKREIVRLNARAPGENGTYMAGSGRSPLYWGSTKHAMHLTRFVSYKSTIERGKPGGAK